MPFGLIIGTDRASALQKSVQDELTARSFSADADPVMAEYITIMIINNKTAAQITSELLDLIGPEFDPSFTDWLFAEAAKGAPESEAPSAASSTPVEPPNESKPIIPPSSEPARRLPNGPRAGAPLYQQAISSTLASTSQKRLRSPSPSAHPAKARRTDLPPTGPRAMQNPVPAQRSLLDRVGGPGPGPRFQGGRDEVQARIDNITNTSPDPSVMMGFPNGMGMPEMGVGMGMQANPIILQEMMYSQMALMAQMANSMGMLNPGMGVPGFNPMQQGGDATMFNGGPGVNGHGFQQNGVNGRGRGGARGGRGRGGPRGGHMGSSPAPASIEEVPTAVSVPTSVVAEPAQPTPIAAPIPLPASATSFNAPSKLAYTFPERPQSPTLCKFGIKCTNSQCRYSHPSPVATAESGVVLSTEACEKGKDCKDKDCIKSHVSPAVKHPGAGSTHTPAAPTTATGPPQHTVTCRFGGACTRPSCPYQHPPKTNHFAQQCRFGSGCTRASCPFHHPEGRVLPSTFHRGLSTTAPLVNVHAPETGSMGGQSHHRSVTFNKPQDVKEKLKDIEKQKEAAKKAIDEAKAAGGKKEETKAVPIAV
ncbi:hypothetical protein DEU56DRAFT_774223 [Suillus clintonianus]|uniref:uncharacterized protein n=1 Tax=Suillus clintonianus TaxID=1904413 RepID=UPI001B871E34|nr:uncharacterized protein DEU56DRAFT_774223 [Suillus clintonianus]KAG2153289.1 hypothetical protein DEU56DRAFT_774223 [Suillus clintonianus]